MSYTTFAHSCARDGSALTFTCTVHNTGTREGDEVLQVYHSLGPAARAVAARDHPVPHRQLVEFSRHTLLSGSSGSVRFELPQTSFAVTRADGSKHVYPGTHIVTFSRGGRSDEVTIEVEMPAAV